MPSIQYQMINGLFKTLRVNKMLDKQGADFKKLLETSKAKQAKPLKIPYKKMNEKFEVHLRLIDGTTCYMIREKDKTPEKTVLYLFGGGYILPPDPGDIILCGEIAENVNAEVWFPLYPMAPVLAKDEEAYLLSPLLFDLTGFPPIELFYGTREVMIAYLKDMKRVCRKYGVPLTVHIGRGMMHCWGAMEFVPEAKAVREEYFEALY